jgi:prepilin-type processing-associated H-X9-DG protein
MPGRAGFGILKLDPSTGEPKGGGSAADGPSGDWIAWNRQIDPVTGVDSGQTARDQNITYSALAPYLSVKPKVHKTAAEANSIALNVEEIFRCPSDNLQQRNKWQQNTSSARYDYSYSMNDLFMNPVQKADTTDYTNVPTPPPDAKQRNGFMFNGKINSIRGASERVLIVCQDEQTIDDGVFKPNAAKWANNTCDLVAARHENKFKQAKQAAFDPLKNVNARGNVGFCDGHAEFMSRKDAISQRYSGHALPDPAGF